MKAVYDCRTDILRVTFTGAPVSERDENKPGVILDYDSLDNLVSLEKPDASQRVGLPTRIEVQLIPTGVG